jgi:hypothetical protein
MAITNYTNLQTTIADFLNRDDLTSVIPTFIQLAEAQLNRDIRHWKMETRSTGTQDAGDQYLEVPGDWLETIRLTHAANGQVLTLASRDEIATRRVKNQGTTEEPFLYNHIDGQIELYPTPSQAEAFELAYYAKIPALSTNETNWLITDHPDVYLYGALAHSAPYLAEDARIAVWAQLYSAAVQNINAASDKARYSGSGVNLKIRGLG